MHGLLSRGGLAAGGLTAGVILAEVILRVTHAFPSGAVLTADSAVFHNIPGIWSPNQYLLDSRNAALPYWIHIDSLGYRGPQFPRLKRPREFRIFLAGDSFTYGSYVDDSETLPARLEQKLRERCPEVRVINGGLGGASIPDEALVVQRALQLKPDLVVLVFYENDITDLARRPIWFELRANRRAQTHFPLSVLYPLLRETALWQLAKQVEGVIRSRSGLAPEVASDPAVAIKWSVSNHSDAVALRTAYRDALVALRDTLARRNVPLFFVAYPSYFTVKAAEEDSPAAWATKAAGAAGIPAVDLWPVFTASRTPADRLYLLPEDIHPTPQGYARAAAFLASRLLERPEVYERACRPAKRRNPHR